MKFRYSVTVLMLVVFVFSLKAQVSFTAESDAVKVLSNGFFNVTFTLNNANGSNFKPPSFQEFKVLSGPNQSSRTTIVNNKRSQSVSYSYKLQPKRLGQLSIAPARITANGKQLQTRPLQIRVEEAQASRNDGSDEVFIEARINHSSAYLGQQLILDYVFYYSVDIQGMNAVDESAYDGFHAREVHEFNKQSANETINGKPFNSQIVKRVVLYPQQTGEITISPLSIVVGVPIPGQRSSNSIFSRTKLRKVPVMSEKITVDVKSLPLPHADGFSDITGNYDFQLRINKDQITTDDALSVILTLKGEGDLKRVQAPALKFPDAFEVYDPKVLTEEYIDRPETIEGTKTFEYLLVPKKAGTFVFQPSLVVFNPDSSAYQILQTRPDEVKILAGSGNGKSGLVAESDRGTALFKARKDIELNTQGNSFIGTPLFWLLFLAPLLAALGLWYTRYMKANQPDIDPVLLQQQQARQAAIKRLDKAKQFMDVNDSKSFFNEVQDALLGYITDKLQMPRADLTKAHVHAKLALLGANEAQITKFSGLVNACEMALYAGMNNADAMQETYEQSLSLLAEMEEVLG